VNGRILNVTEVAVPVVVTNAAGKAEPATQVVTTVWALTNQGIVVFTRNGAPWEVFELPKIVPQTPQGVG
jgi:hypothetical protein